MHKVQKNSHTEAQETLELKMTDPKGNFNCDQHFLFRKNS